MKYAAFFLIALGAHAQLVPAGGAIPRRSKPPVVFLNGYQLVCAGSSFAGTFGKADTVLAANGQASVFFDNCRYAGKPSIEELGKNFGDFLGGLRYDDGSPVSQVDVIAHSMGGLIVRSYLSGKSEAGGFAPPPQIRIRKAVFIATPHFGTTILAQAAQLGSIPMDKQLSELGTGSPFLFDLATWNQETDDLRGVDAISILGTGGNALAAPSGFSDGVVTLSSGSSLFWGTAARTRLLPLCHTSSAGIPLVAIVCPSGNAIADLSSDSADNTKIVLSFLNGTNEWQNLGASAAGNSYLATQAGIQVSARTAADKPLGIDSATVANGTRSDKLNSTIEVAYSELLPAGAVTISATSGSVNVQAPATLLPGGTQAFVVKPGPHIARAYPAGSRVFPISVAPGEIIAIYGTALDNGKARVNDTPLTAYYTSASQINAFLPDGISGLVKLTVETPAGSHTLNLMIDPAVPSIFTQADSGEGPAKALNALTGQLVTAANPLKAGDYVSIYMTGLGGVEARGGLSWAAIQPTVTVGGRNCPVQFAGRAPTFTGLDQVNCQVPPGLPSGPADLIVTSGGRASNTATLAVQ